MTNIYFEEIMAELGFHTVDSIAVGCPFGYPLSVEFEKDAEGERFVFRWVVNGEAKPSLKPLKEKEMDNFRWFAERGEEDKGVLVGVLTPPSDFYVKSAVFSAQAAVPEVLKETGLVPPEECPLCGAGGCDRYAYIEEGCRAVHRICLETRLDLPQEDKKTPLKVRGYYLTGIVGALLGAAIAALPNWSQALSKGTISSVIYAFIPLLSALLYRLFRGKARLAASGAIVLVSSLVVAFLMELVWYWLVATSMEGYNISIAETSKMYFDGHNIGLIIREMLFSLLFLLLGFFPASILLRRYAASGTTGGRLQRGATFVRESAFRVVEGKAVPDKKEETEERVEQEAKTNRPATQNGEDDTYGS